VLTERATSDGSLHMSAWFSVLKEAASTFCGRPSATFVIPFTIKPLLRLADTGVLLTAVTSAVTQEDGVEGQSAADEWVADQRESNTTGCITCIIAEPTVRSLNSDSSRLVTDVFLMH